MEEAVPPGPSVLDRLRLVLPHAALVASTVLVAVTLDEAEIQRQPFGLSVALALVTAGWIAWLVTLHPAWQHRRRLMAVFFAGLITLTAVLIWTNPLYGFFAWTGYLLAPYALQGRRQLFGASCVGFCTAVSQMGGFPALADPGQWGKFLIVLVLNLAIGTGMTFLGLVTDSHHARRAAMLDELSEANRRLAAALTENASLTRGLTGIVTHLDAADPAEDLPQRLDAARRLARDSLAEAHRSHRPPAP